MTHQEAQAELQELRGFAESGGNLATYKERVASLYWQVCRKTLRQCNCKDILKDALIEIYSKLLTITDKDMTSQARLVAGVVIFCNNNHYTNANLTDEVAREFLAKFPQRKDWFAVLPSATTAKEVVAEVAEIPEKGQEIAPKEVEPKTQPNTPKKKKIAKKGK